MKMQNDAILETLESIIKALKLKADENESYAYKCGFYEEQAKRALTELSQLAERLK